MSVVEVKKAADIKLGENYQLKALGYGRSGVGKTRILRSLPGKKFVIDTDGGELTNRGAPDIDYVTIPMQYANSFEGWVAYLDARAYFLQHKAEYRSAVIDSITTLAENAMSKVLKQNNHASATLPDYMQEMQLVEAEVKWWIAQGVHIYFVAHEDVDRDEITGQIWYKPAARGQLAGKLPKWVDEVYHLRAVKGASGKVEYRMLVRADVIYTCKSRLAESTEIDAEQPQDFVAYAKKCGVELK
jgi:phage nucleotide-binding protein